MPIIIEFILDTVRAVLNESIDMVDAIKKLHELCLGEGEFNYNDGMREVILTKRMLSFSDNNEIFYFHDDIVIFGNINDLVCVDREGNIGYSIMLRDVMLAWNDKMLVVATDNVRHSYIVPTLNSDIYNDIIRFKESIAEKYRWRSNEEQQTIVTMVDIMTTWINCIYYKKTFNMIEYFKEEVLSVKTLNVLFSNDCCNMRMRSPSPTRRQKIPPVVKSKKLQPRRIDRTEEELDDVTTMMRRSRISSYCNN